MLILTRRVGETLVIDGGIKITVLGYKGNHVRLGIDAPSDVTVHREEIYQKIQTDENGGKGDIYFQNLDFGDESADGRR